MKSIKLRAISIVFAIISVLSLSSCNDNLTGVGEGIQPIIDKITVYCDTIRFNTETVPFDSVYSVASQTYLGRINDPFFGSVKTDYLTEFYCPEGFQFEYLPENGKIDSVKLLLQYDSWAGDSISPLHTSIYRLNKLLPQNMWYTKFDPSEYFEKGSIIGQTTYIPYDDRTPTSQKESKAIVRVIEIKLPPEFGQKIYDETISNPSSFSTQDKFNTFFPGLYISNDLGTGSVLKIENTFLDLYYHTKSIVKDSVGKDSIVISVKNERFRNTREVKTFQHFTTEFDENLLIKDENRSYMKTPCGYITKLIIPIQHIKQIVKGRTIDDIPLSLKIYDREKIENVFPMPANILLLPKDSVRNFFINRHVPASQPLTSYLAEYSPTQRLFNFGNISALVNLHIKNTPDKDLELYLLPVYVEKAGAESSGKNITSVSQYLLPGALSFRTGKKDRIIPIITTKFNK